MPKFVVERNWIEVVGAIWMPPTKAAQRIDVDGYAIENMKDDAGAITRDSVEDWLGRHTGDFQSIDDFAAYVGDTEIPWRDEESEFIYADCMFPSEDD